MIIRSIQEERTFAYHTAQMNELLFWESLAFVAPSFCPTTFSLGGFQQP